MITAKDILKLIKQGEGFSLEMKACKDTLPRSVWETYSAFANSRGGIILLGVTEQKGRSAASRYEITGVSNSFKIVTDFWNVINNTQKVSRDILIDSDVRVIEVEDKEIVYINVPEADYHKKPIYINNDIQNGTYKRTHEGDRHVDMEELSMLIRDSSDDIDSQIMEHYTIDDIDSTTLANYRRAFVSFNPEHTYKISTIKNFFVIWVAMQAIDTRERKV